MGHCTSGYQVGGLVNLAADCGRRRLLLAVKDTRRDAILTMDTRSSHHCHLDRHCLTTTSPGRIVTGSNDLHRFWECEMDVGHAVNIQRIHLESCMRHSSCYDKTLANTSGLRSKNTDLASRYFFCGPERCRICIRMQYVRFRNVQHPETRSCDGVHCTPPGSGV